MTKQITRRRLIHLAIAGVGASASASLLQACASPAPTPTSKPAPPAPTKAAAPTATTVPAAATKAPAPTTAPAVAKKGGTLVIGWQGKTSNTNLCVQKIYDGRSDLYLRRAVASGLVQWSTDFSKILPDLAEKWTFQGNTCTFTLRKGVKWHDGTPFTAKDVAFTFRVIGHPDSTFTAVQFIDSMIVGMKDFTAKKADKIAGITVKDDSTIVFEMTKPYRDFFLAAAANYAMVPEHILGKVPETQWKEEGLCKTDFALKKAIGTGPFKIVSHVPDQAIEYEANPDYFRGKPALDKLVYRSFTDWTALAAALEKGEVHVGPIQPAEYERFQKMSHVKVVPHPNLMGRGVNFNTRQPYLEKRVLHALTYALDREKICKQLFYGAVTPPPAPFIHAKYGVSPNITKFPYDVAKAKQLLQEAKWDPSRKLRWLQSQVTPDMEPYYGIVRDYWAAAGVQSEFVVVGADFAKFTSPPYDFDFYYSGMAWGLTPADAVGNYWGDKRLGEDNPQAQELLAKIMVTDSAEEEKKGAWQLQEIAADEARIIFTHQDPGLYVVNKKVQGEILPIYALWSRNDWGLEKLSVSD